MRWFRFYDSVLDDPKAQRLSDKHFRAWVNLLCLASRSDGFITTDFGEIAFSLRVSESQARNIVKTLVAAGLLEQGETFYKPHNWDGRQFKSDVSTERVKRFRKRQRNGEGTVNETPPDTETESETDIIHPSDGRALEPKAPLSEALAIFNETASKAGWQRAKKLTPQRQVSLKARLRDCGGLEGWSAAMARAAQSAFLCGRVPRSNGHVSWVPDLDFFLSQKHLTKLLEGGYDDRAPAGSVLDLEALARIEEEIKHGGH